MRDPDFLWLLYAILLVEDYKRSVHYLFRKFSFSGFKTLPSSGRMKQCNESTHCTLTHEKHPDESCANENGFLCFQVRDGAMSCLVEIYRHVGERVRMDLSKKGLPQSRYADRTPSA